jgi:hypothetical protein
MFEIILYNSSNCELDRKRGDNLSDLLIDMANDDCLSGGDYIKLVDLEDEGRD